MTATAITSTVKSQSTTTITSTTKQTTTAPRRKVTYECARRTNECGCSMTNVIVTENDPQLPSSSITTNQIGEDAYPYSWSMIVSIQVNNTKHTCTGTILSDSFILTAAHCVEVLSNNTMITIAAGIHTLSQYITSSRWVDQVFVHENYINQEPYLHDIAILHLEQPLELNYQPIFSQICLSNTNSIDSIKTPNLFSVGWKHSNVLDNENTNNIQQVSIKSMVTQNSTCYNSIYNETYQFCAGLILNHTDLCEENFGEPVFIYKNQYWEQVGILSNTYGCVPTGHSGVYTRLSAYTEWIKNIMKNTPIPMRSNKGLKLEENIFLFTILLLFLKIQF